MAVVVRMLVVVFGYGLACIAASFILTIGTLTPDWDYLNSLGLQAAAVWVIVVFGAVFIGAVAVLPALLVIALAENFGWRSVLVYAVLGGALSLALCYGIDFAGYTGAPDGLMAREREVFAAAGIAGGLVYWLFAGRNAGAWKQAA